MADDEKLAYLRGESGVVRPHRLPLPEGIADRVTKGYIKRVNEDGTDWVPGDEAGDAPEQERDATQGDPVTKRPSVSALKPEWVGYAVSLPGGPTPDDAEAMTKNDLIDKYGK